MINVRAELEEAWHPVTDALWDYLDERGYVGEVADGAETIEYLIQEARQVIAAGRPAMPQTAGNQVARQLALRASGAVLTYDPDTRTIRTGGSGMIAVTTGHNR